MNCIFGAVGTAGLACPAARRAGRDVGRAVRRGVWAPGAVCQAAANLFTIVKFYLVKVYNLKVILHWCVLYTNEYLTGTSSSCRSPSTSTTFRRSSSSAGPPARPSHRPCALAQGPGRLTHYVSSHLCSTTLYVSCSPLDDWPTFCEGPVKALGVGCRCGWSRGPQVGPPGSGAPMHSHCNALNSLLYGLKRWCGLAHT